MDTTPHLNRETGKWETWPGVRCPHKRPQKAICGELYGLSLTREAAPLHYACNRCGRLWSAREVAILDRNQTPAPIRLEVVRSDTHEQLELPE